MLLLGPSVLHCAFGTFSPFLHARLQQNLQDVKSDPETIRKIAREEYGLAGANEVIIKLPAPKPADPPPAKP